VAVPVYLREPIPSRIRKVCGKGSRRWSWAPLSAMRRVGFGRDLILTGWHGAVNHPRIPCGASDIILIHARFDLDAEALPYGTTIGMIPWHHRGPAARPTHFK